MVLAPDKSTLMNEPSKVIVLPGIVKGNKSEQLPLGDQLNPEFQNLAARSKIWADGSSSWSWNNVIQEIDFMRTHELAHYENSWANSVMRVNELAQIMSLLLSVHQEEEETMLWRWGSQQLIVGDINTENSRL